MGSGHRQRGPGVALVALPGLCTCSPHGDGLALQSRGFPQSNPAGSRHPRLQARALFMPTLSYTSCSSSSTSSVEQKHGVRLVPSPQTPREHLQLLLLSSSSQDAAPHTDSPATPRLSRAKIGPMARQLSGHGSRLASPWGIKTQSFGTTAPGLSSRILIAIWICRAYTVSDFHSHQMVRMSTGLLALSLHQSARENNSAQNVV